MAAVVQLCVGIYVLVYHTSVADEHYGLLAAFLLDEEYTFVGVDINNDEKKLKRVGLVVQNFVDIQNMWRVPDPVTIKPKYGLADYASSIIHHSYNKMKDVLTEDDHHMGRSALALEEHLLCFHGRVCHLRRIQAVGELPEGVRESAPASRQTI